MKTTLNDLISLAAQGFPGARLGAEHLLLVWVDNDPADELNGILARAGSSTASLAKVLRPLIAGPGTEDDSIVSSCLTDKTDNPATGVDLLLKLKAGKNRSFFLVQLDSLLTGRHGVPEKLLGFAVSILAVDQHFVDVV